MTATLSRPSTRGRGSPGPWAAAAAVAGGGLALAGLAWRAGALGPADPFDAWDLGGPGWHPEEEWLLELNSALPARIDANTRRFRGVRDRMRRKYKGRLPVTFAYISKKGGPDGLGVQEIYEEAWATPNDSVNKVRCVHAAYYLGVNCVPIEMACAKPYAKPHVLVMVKVPDERGIGRKWGNSGKAKHYEEVLRQCMALGPQVVLAVDPVDDSKWCARAYSLEGFHAVVVDNSALAELETDGTVWDEEVLNPRSRVCKRRLPAGRVFVIPHHHQMAIDLSKPRRPTRRGTFTVGLQGGDPFPDPTQSLTHRPGGGGQRRDAPRPSHAYEAADYPFRPAAGDGAGRPVVFAEAKSALTRKAGTTTHFSSLDMFEIQREWDMSISWNSLHRGDHPCPDLRQCLMKLICKSGQRFSNALALGVPAVGFAGYPGMQDACQGSKLCLTALEADDVRRMVADLAANPRKYRRYQKSAARLARAYHPEQIARRYVAMARALLDHAEDVHRSPIRDTADCEPKATSADTEDVGGERMMRGVVDFFRRRHPAIFAAEEANARTWATTDAR